MAGKAFRGSLPPAPSPTPPPSLLSPLSSSPSQLYALCSLAGPETVTWGQAGALPAKDLLCPGMGAAMQCPCGEKTHQCLQLQDPGSLHNGWATRRE